MSPAAIRPSVGYMTTTTIVSIVVGVAIAALLVVRQMRSQPVNGNMRLPLIIGIIGLIEVTRYLQKVHGRVGGTAIAALIGRLHPRRRARRGAGRDGAPVGTGRPGLAEGQLADRHAVGRQPGCALRPGLPDRPALPKRRHRRCVPPALLAVTFTVQRVIMCGRARRIPEPSYSAQSVSQGPARPWSQPWSRP